MTSGSWRTRSHDAVPADRERVLERHVSGAAGVGVYADSPQGGGEAPAGDAGRVHHLVPVPGELRRVSRASGIEAVRTRGDGPAYGVLRDPADTHGTGGNGPGAGRGDAAARVGRAL